MDFYNKFIELCNKKGVKPSPMLESIGIQKSANSNWKKRKSKPTSANLQKIADYFGVTVEYLKGEQETKNSPEEPKLTEGEEMLLSLFRQIPEERQPEALELLRVALKMQKKP